ncbi:hypothetical protein [Heyndrickxia sporothermodurans]|uniref:hypothetical protein n=1 Tax=Heyndrickxia sporothermodurans TaxID=46224 RepID=UPI0035DEA111
MKSITRNYHGYDSLENEHFTDTQLAIIIDKRTLMYCDDLGITFEHFAYDIADNEEAIDIHAGDKSHHGVEIPFPASHRVDIRKLASMTLAEYGRLLFAKGETE